VGAPRWLAAAGADRSTGGLRGALRGHESRSKRGCLAFHLFGLGLIASRAEARGVSLGDNPLEPAFWQSLSGRCGLTGLMLFFSWPPPEIH